MKDVLHTMSKDDLIKLIEMYSKNLLAFDGTWFQAVERTYGMDGAMKCDIDAWKVYTVSEARRIKQFLNLPVQAGLEGLANALSLRFFANINKDEIKCDGNVLIYRNVDCCTQTARKRKGMQFHPCKSVGIVEYSGFAHVIDDRIQCECLSCFPDVTDATCACAWKFTLVDNVE